MIRGYVWTFISAEKITTGLALVATILICGCVIFSGRDLLNRNGPILLVLFVLTNLLMQLVLHKGYIATRVLNAFYAFHVLCLYELLSMSLSKLKRIQRRRGKKPTLAHMDIAVRWVKAAICVFVIILCLGNTDLYSTRDDSMDFKFKTWVEGAELTGIDYPGDMYRNAAEVFYEQKIENQKTKYIEQMREYGITE